MKLSSPSACRCIINRTAPPPPRQSPSLSVSCYKELVPVRPRLRWFLGCRLRLFRLVNMRFEEVLEDVGGFSKFQVLVVSILCFPRIILPLHFLLHNFISATPPHRCALRGPEEPDLEALDLRIPRQDNGSFSSCRVYSPPSELLQRNRTEPCPQGWVYDRSQFSSTTASEVRKRGNSRRRRALKH